MANELRAITDLLYEIESVLTVKGQWPTARRIGYSIKQAFQVLKEREGSPHIRYPECYKQVLKYDDDENNPAFQPLDGLPKLIRPRYEID